MVNNGNDESRRHNLYIRFKLKHLKVKQTGITKPNMTVSDILTNMRKMDHNTLQ